jgi:hypothetical protein
MNLTITINSKSIAEQLNESHLRNYDPQVPVLLDSCQFNVIDPSPLVPAQGVFRDDPAWDSFQRSIGEYRDQADAFERSLE